MKNEIRKIVREILEETYINEYGPITDSEGIASNLVSYYTSGGYPNFEQADKAVYDMAKKTLDGHDADVESKKNFYLILSNKIKELANSIDDENLKRKLNTSSQSYSSIARNSINEAEIQDTGGLKIKKRNSEEEVSVQTGMLVQKAFDETSKGKVVNIGVNFEVIPHTNNINVHWYHGDLAGTKQKVDPEDIVAQD